MTSSEMAIKAAEQLLGTKIAVDDLNEDFKDLMLSNAEFCSKFDQLIFKCLVCDVWSNNSDMGREEWVCESCSP